MDERTLTALKASIEHWELNAKADEPGMAATTASDCSLCRQFHQHFRYNYGEGCLGCPVFGRTGLAGCRGTPFEAADSALFRWDHDPGSSEKRDTWRAAAQAELDFLRSLLPADEASP